MPQGYLCLQTELSGLHTHTHTHTQTITLASLTHRDTPPHTLATGTVEVRDFNQAKRIVCIHKKTSFVINLHVSNRWLFMKRGVGDLGGGGDGGGQRAYNFGIHW